ncbi:MAG: Hpt domain-containing protein, partial [Campylobacterales bacterium]
MDHQKIIDLTQLIELVNNDRTTLQQMLHLFITQSEEKLHAAIEALNKSDFKNLKEITHDLKGSSG